jgi:hypothetical protein
MDNQDVIKIKPTLLKIFISNVILVLIILLLISSIFFAIGGLHKLERMLEENIIPYVFIVIAFTFIDYVRSDKKTIILSSAGITGPSGKKYNKLEFIEYSNIDKILTKKQSIYQNIMGYRYIYSVTGAVIICSPNLYSKKNRELLLERILVNE